MRRNFRTLCGAVALSALLVAPASAHPHIFIDAKATVVFDDAGDVAAIRNSWTFDEAFSVWQVQGLDVDGDGVTSSTEMQELADDNVAGLAEYGFYTSAGEGRDSIAFVSNDDGRFEFRDNRSTLTFSIAPERPYRISDTLQVSIADPEYYVAMTFAGPADVALENAPPGCTVRLQPGREISDDLAARLFELPPDVTKLPNDLEIALRGAQGAILVSCPPAAGGRPVVAETALDAVTEVAEAKPLPFGGPPAEPGLQMPRTGFFGWVAKMQSDFYQSLTAALARLKTDGSAFWLLGGLSFLYGVFHAAGPGHGKVVISSYMLANEQQAKRGIMLSFAAAMLSSLVAIGFVSIAAAVLGLSSSAMGVAANWIGIASYIMVMLLGLWLIARKLLGFGHAHAAPRRDAHGRAPGDPHFGHDHGTSHHHGHDHHAHGHDHGHDGHDHAHIVTPDAAGGDWREQLGVVLGVGLRPCSGALVVMVFALSQGILAAGIVSVLLMGLGTAITVSVLATVAVTAKGLARKLLGAENRGTLAVVWWAELLGAVLVFGFGLVLLIASI